MLRKVRKFITEKHMIDPGDRLILGLSGGRDSVCLFHVLERLGPEMGFSFTAVHVNHGIRGEEALRDEEFADALCRKYGIQKSRCEFLFVHKVLFHQGFCLSRCCDICPHCSKCADVFDLDLLACVAVYIVENAL